MLGREAEVDLGHDNIGMVRNEAAHLVLKGRGPSPTVDMTAAVCEYAHGQSPIASSWVSGCVDADGNSRVGNFLIYE